MAWTQWVLTRNGRWDHGQLRFLFVDLLDDSDSTVRQSAFALLCSFEKELDVAARPVVDDYTRILRGRGEADLSPNLVGYLYLVFGNDTLSPGAGFRIIAQAFQPVNAPERARYRKLLLAEHVIADSLWRELHGHIGRGEATPEALAAFRELVADPAWWVRYYAACLGDAIRPRAFYKDAAFELLRKDANELVRRTAVEGQWFQFRR